MRIAAMLLFSGVLGAAVTFPVSGNGYTLSLIQPGMMQVDGPTSAGTVILTIVDVYYFESILVGSANRAAFLGKRASNSRWFVTVAPLYQPGGILGAAGTPFGFDETSNIIEVPAFTYHIDQTVAPVLFERGGYLWARSLFHANNGTDPDLVIEANTRAIISETPEPASLGLISVGLLIAARARR